MNVEEINYQNHKDKCRICLQKLKGSVQKLQIDEKIEKMFYEISNIEVCLLLIVLQKKKQ